MATKARMDTKGLEDLLEAIATMGRDVDTAAASAIEAGAQVLADGMRARVAVDTGDLKDRIQIEGPGRDGNYIYIEVGILRPDAALARKANANEYGTSSMAAHPFVRPTIAEDKSKARKAMIAVLKEMML